MLLYRYLYFVWNHTLSFSFYRGRFLTELRNDDSRRGWVEVYINIASRRSRWQQVHEKYTQCAPPPRTGVMTEYMTGMYYLRSLGLPDRGRSRRYFIKETMLHPRSKVSGNTILYTVLYPHFVLSEYVLFLTIPTQVRHNPIYNSVSETTNRTADILEP